MLFYFLQHLFYFIAHETTSLCLKCMTLLEMIAFKSSWHTWTHTQTNNIRLHTARCDSNTPPFLRATSPVSLWYPVYEYYWIRYVDDDECFHILQRHQLIAVSADFPELFTTRCDTQHITHLEWRFGAVGSDVGQINEVTLRRPG